MLPQKNNVLKSLFVFFFGAMHLASTCAGKKVMGRSTIIPAEYFWLSNGKWHPKLQKIGGDIQLDK